MRRGQLFSLDAMLALIVVIMILGTFTSASEDIKAEVTSLLGWYERANIGDGMMDLLVKSPGDPGDWEDNPSDVKVVGLRDDNYYFALDYGKLLALNSSKDQLKDALYSMASGKDFLLEVYLSRFKVNVDGSFPRYYLYNLILPGNDLGNVKISLAGNGNKEFPVSYISLTRGGTTYVGKEVCSLAQGGGNNVFLERNDYLVFVATQEIDVTVQGKQKFEETLPQNVRVEFRVLDSTSSYHMKVDGCPHNVTSIHIGGQGQVQIQISAYDNASPQIVSNFTSAQNFVEMGEPAYGFALINGSVVEDATTINESMARSPWIEPVDRYIMVSTFFYNLSAGPSKEEPILYGVMRYNPPLETSLRISVGSSSQGNLTLVSLLGTEVRGLFVYGNQGELNATLVYYENGEAHTKHYRGVNGVITVPFKDLFGSVDATDKPIGLWLYSLEGWRRDDVGLEITPGIRFLMGPRFDGAVIKLLVWDDS
ncbi:hypothetical protein A3L12_03205 [Thermococcus sp. P6]|uniref:hypothetical protein n=1 Tax=Thermococcus sp. P6 TaxID=122420 RepID=UPI000B59D3E0|nr:hypothetical protein [Thermococcus sp. P6]ASJ10376.1 hypothetical protein A3L12_03205 [Thermococcus sp. P6]